MSKPYFNLQKFAGDDLGPLFKNALLHIDNFPENVTQINITTDVSTYIYEPDYPYVSIEYIATMQYIDIFCSQETVIPDFVLFNVTHSQSSATYYSNYYRYLMGDSLEPRIQAITITFAQPTPSGHTVTIDGTDYTIDDNTNLLVNSTGLYNSTTSAQVWTYSGDTAFKGFATTSGGAIVYDINDTITLTADLTLYSVEQERMPLYINGVRTDKYNNKVVNKIGDYFVARYEYSITTTVTNGTYSGSTSILADNGTATVTITADSGYDLPSSITVTGASYTYVGGVISLSNPTGDVTISVVCEAVASGYEVELNGWDGEEGYIYVQINDDPTWYYAQLGVGLGFTTSLTNIPNVYQKIPNESIAIPNVSKIKIGTQGNPTSYSGPRYSGGGGLSTGDFANLTFTSTGGSAPAYATGEITMTQDSKVRFIQAF